MANVNLNSCKDEFKALRTEVGLFWPHLEVLDIRRTGKRARSKYVLMHAGYFKKEDILKVVAGHSKLHTIFVSNSIKIPNIRVVVDDLHDQDDLSSIISKLQENKEYINGINFVNVTSRCTLLAVVYGLECDSNSPYFAGVTAMLELGANPYEPVYRTESQSNYNPWKPYYPNPHNIWGPPHKKVESTYNFIELVNNISINLIGFRY